VTAAPLPTDRSGATAPAAPETASFARRLASACYELLLLAAVVVAVGFLLAPVMSPAPGTFAPTALRVPTLAARILSFATLFAVAGLYYLWSWTGGRRTLPMKTWRLRLVTVDGAVPGAGRALLRYGAAWIGPCAAVLAYTALAPSGHGRSALWLALVNYAWAMVDPARQFLHDRIAGTRLIRVAGAR
jgi:uncharacterized RDD family membrane protein YckC